MNEGGSESGGGAEQNDGEGFSSEPGRSKKDENRELSKGVEGKEDVPSKRFLHHHTCNERH